MAEMTDYDRQTRCGRTSPSSRSRLGVGGLCTGIKHAHVDLQAAAT